ncbi:uncharacterized protein F5891DRAFT_999174 [Suillus fuscotomentosus]|uniref:Secreted protein n=1 Tax=Suillus fuscotomentosus TaxID=1912939 RepID=A0AAD4EIJ9_9AGAM|nr:uncharacterized protein F5891DRAFT_999174 [Suillus fuscotomentosus]KAG1906878.1 hypothetical protein F5891DRAFT_999174 [Suillus fuscotomentosus]
MSLLSGSVVVFLHLCVLLVGSPRSHSRDSVCPHTLENHTWTQGGLVTTRPRRSTPGPLEWNRKSVPRQDLPNEVPPLIKNSAN